MKTVAYIRCSTEGQATEGVSLETQEDAIRRYAEYRGLEIVEIIKDAGISGGVNKAREGFVLLLGVCCVTLYIRFGVRYERVAWKITDS